MARTTCILNLLLTGTRVAPMRIRSRPSSPRLLAQFDPKLRALLASLFLHGVLLFILEWRAPHKVVSNEVVRDKVLEVEVHEGTKIEVAGIRGPRDRRSGQTGQTYKGQGKIRSRLNGFN